MYAIVGAVALEKGGVDANKVAQKRILVPLGMKIA
jgi:large subunit ribosomal protein L15